MSVKMRCSFVKFERKKERKKSLASLFSESRFTLSLSLSLSFSLSLSHSRSLTFQTKARISVFIGGKGWISYDIGLFVKLRKCLLVLTNSCLPARILRTKAF